MNFWYSWVETISMWDNLTEVIFFLFLSHQAVNQQLEQAQQSLSSASGEEDKAKAQIAVECLDALSKALGH